MKCKLYKSLGPPDTSRNIVSIADPPLLPIRNFVLCNFYKYREINFLEHFVKKAERNLKKTITIILQKLTTRLL